MKVRVLYFALLREKIGRSEDVREVESGTTVGELWGRLCAEYPALEPMRESVSLAVNREYVERSRVLKEGDEVALVPPVSGGC